jgi:STE24 endopeptidase
MTTSETYSEAKVYERKKITFTIYIVLLDIAYLLFMSVIGGKWLADFTAHLSSNIWILLFVFAIIFGLGAELVSFPLKFWLSYVIEHEFLLSNQSINEWLVKLGKSYLITSIIGLVFIAAIYFFLWNYSSYWWVFASVLWIFFSIISGFIVTTFIVPFFYKVSPFTNFSLQERFIRLCKNTKIQLDNISVVKLSKETRKANAFFAGIGNTKRVFLADTLIDNFNDDEIEIVFAHELGHCQLNHLFKDIIFSSIISFIAFFICHIVLVNLAKLLGHASFTAVSAMPLFFLCLTIISLCILPIQNCLSRHLEKEADEYALQNTNKTDAFETAFTKLAIQNKANINPNKIIAWLFYSHPPIKDRIEFAKSWSKNHSIN